MKSLLRKTINYSLRKASNRCMIPLSQQLPSLPNYSGKNLAKTHSNDTQITKLSNGLTVATENRFGHFCTVGICIKSGSRFEVAYPRGINHFLEKLAFNSTHNYKNKDHILAEFEKQCGIFDCQASRDTLIYAASAELKGIDKVVDILSEIVLQPHFIDSELVNARKAITFELEDMGLKPDQEPLLMDLIHAAAFRDNTLGLPKLCPTENIVKIDREMLYTYMRDHFIPERIVIVGVGIEHERLLEAIDKTFVKKIPIWMTYTPPSQQNDSTNVTKFESIGPGVDTSIAQYTGGLIRKEKDMSNLLIGPNPLPELAHVVIGLEGVPYYTTAKNSSVNTVNTYTASRHFVSACVLNTLMGGGGSFSAGGPGKGMYSRLYTNVLNMHHWIFNATAYNHTYSDTGLFCIHASTHPSQLSQLVDVITQELVHMGQDINKIELERSKKQLQSMLMMNLESRPTVFEDIGRQILTSGWRKPPEQMLQEISEVTQDDIVKIVTKLLSSKPAVGALGSLKHLPYYERVHTTLVRGYDQYYKHIDFRYELPSQTIHNDSTLPKSENNETFNNINNNKTKIPKEDNIHNDKNENSINNTANEKAMKI